MTFQPGFTFPEITQRTGSRSSASLRNGCPEECIKQLVLPVTHPASQPFIQASRHQAASKLEGSAADAAAFTSDHIHKFYTWFHAETLWTSSNLFCFLSQSNTFCHIFCILVGIRIHYIQLLRLLPYIL